MDDFSWVNDLEEIAVSVDYNNDEIRALFDDPAAAASFINPDDEVRIIITSETDPYRHYWRVTRKV